MYKDIQSYCKGCKLCQSHKIKTYKRNTLLKQFPGLFPFDIVCIDVAGSLYIYERVKIIKYKLCVVNKFTCYVELAPMNDCTAKQKQIFCLKIKFVDTQYQIKFFQTMHQTLMQKW